MGQDESWGRDFCLAVFRANFQHDLDIQAEDVVHDLLRDLAGRGRADRRAKTEAVKESLRRQVDRARNLGLFGAHLFVGDEMFWATTGSRMRWRGRNRAVRPRHGPRRRVGLRPFNRLMAAHALNKAAPTVFPTPSA